MPKHKDLKNGVWQDWWPIIYEAVRLNSIDPEKYPLHPNFWGYTRDCLLDFWGHRHYSGRNPREPFPERILEIGPTPRHYEVEEAIGYGKGECDTWLLRRVCHIKGLELPAH